MGTPSREECARQLAARGHNLRLDEWSAWCLAVQFAEESGHPDALAVYQGAGRVEEFKRPTDRQYRAADAVWKAAIEELRTS